MGIIACRDLLNDDPTEIGLAEEEVIREISEGLQNLTVIPNEHRMSVNEWLDIDRNEQMGETLSDEAIIEIVQPPAIRENESGESDEEVENPPQTITTREATAALEFLITYMKQHPRLQHVSDHLHGTWALKLDIDLLNQQVLVQTTLMNFLKSNDLSWIVPFVIYAVNKVLLDKTNFVTYFTVALTIMIYLC